MKRFPCEYCHEGVHGEGATPTCGTCGTVYRVDGANGTISLATSRARQVDTVAIVLGGLGILELFIRDESSALAWFLIFVAFALHYWNGIRCGVLRSRFFIFRWSWAVYRCESPTAFTIALVVEGLWVLGFFFIFLFSL